MLKDTGPLNSSSWNNFPRHKLFPIKIYCIMVTNM